MQKPKGRAPSGPVQRLPAMVNRNLGKMIGTFVPFTGTALTFRLGSVRDRRLMQERSMHSDSGQPQQLRMEPERPKNAYSRAADETDSLFRLLFERTRDPIWLFDPAIGTVKDCNEATVALMRYQGKAELLGKRVEDLSPPFQPDGSATSDLAAHGIAETLRCGNMRFEWTARRCDGTEVPLEVNATAIERNGRPVLVLISRDISGRKAGVKEMVVELVRSNEQLRRAEENMRQRNEQVQIHRDVLLEIAQSDTSDLDTALQKICSQSAATLDVARVSYWSLRESHSAIACEILYLRDTKRCHEQFKGSRLTLSDCPSYFEALAANHPIVANCAMTHPATSVLAENYLRPLGISSMLDAPVWLRGEVVGVLCHEHIGPSRTWSAEEIDFVSALAAMVSVALEESHRALSEHLLRKSEEKFRALFEGTSQPAVLHDENGILDVNPSWLRLFGYSRLEDVKGKHPAEVSAPIQPGGERADVLAKKHIAKALAEGSARFEWMIIRSDGTEVPIEVFLSPVQLGGRQLIQAVCNDITVRKRAEEELRRSETRLRESEARFSTAFRASPVLITISRVSDARFIEANDAFVRWLGLSHEKIVGHDSVELGIWVSVDERAKFLLELQRKGSLTDVECQLRSQRGTIHTMLMSADLIEINREPHLLVFGLDITQRKQAEIELLRTLEREKELGLLRSKFVSMVSHEFRTPLAIIQSSAEILDDYLDRLEQAERKHHLQSILKNTRRMATLMEETLLIGSFEAGTIEFKPEPLELPAFARRLVDEVHSASDRRCPIEFSLSEIPGRMLADERLLRRIFTNLLTNAVKYSDVGQVVQFDIDSAGPDIVCTIRDQGIGIPEADREWLFHAFHRGRNVGDRPGTGLGLVIVKRCVDLHGGKISMVSNPGQGTSVTVRIPILNPKFPAEDDAKLILKG